MPSNEKGRYVLISGFQQYIAGLAVTNLWHNPIRRRIIYTGYNYDNYPADVFFSLDKMGVLVGHILKIKSKFNEDRKKATLNFNEEQIHKYDK